jgi:hypothetical protein
MSSASVCFATTPLSQPAELTAWSVTVLPPARDRLPTTVNWSRYGSSGLRIGVISRSPAAFGVQKFIGAPFGKYTAPNRCGGFAGVWARADSAGTIDSRNGKASVVPMPRSMVRRDNALFVTNMVSSFELSVRGLRLLPHLEGRALHDPQHD